MESDPEHIKLMRQVFGNNAELPVARPACWHDRRWIRDAGSSRIPDHLRLDYKTHPERICDFLRNLLRGVMW